MVSIFSQCAVSSQSQLRRDMILRGLHLYKRLASFFVDAFTGEPAEVMAALKTSLDSVAKAQQKSTDRPTLCVCNGYFVGREKEE